MGHDVRLNVMPYRPALAYLVCFVVIAGLNLVAYSPGLEGPFMFDDRPNILKNPGVRMKDLTWGTIADAGLSKHEVGYLHRPLPRITFALNYFSSGRKFDPFAFKLTNLAIHVANSGLLLLFGIMVLASLRLREAGAKVERYRHPVWFWLPVALALLWSLHPIQLTSVLYVVQRMTSMAGTAVLLGIILFVGGRLRYAEDRPYGLTLMGLGIGLGTLLGFLCKENGVLVPGFAALLELFLFRRDRLAAASRRRLVVFYGTSLAILVLAGVMLLISARDLLMETYVTRTFTPLERLLTQSRVLFYYLGLLIFPNLREFSLYHDDLAVSTGLLSPWTTLVSILAVLGLVTVIITGTRRGSVLALGIAWYLLGHSLESTFLGLEMVHEHRNYVPSLGIFMAVAFLGCRSIELRPRLAKIGLCAGIGAVAVLAFVTHTRAAVWSSLDTLSYFMVRDHPASYRAHVERGFVLERRGTSVNETYAAYRAAVSLNPQAAIPLTKMQRIVYAALNSLSNQHVPGDNAEPPPFSDTLAADLFFDMAYLRRLDGAIAAEYTRRLKEYPINAETLSALDALKACVVSRVPDCPPFARVDGWLQLALEREEIIPLQEAALLLMRARLAIHIGDVSQGVAMMERAFEVSEEVGFLIELAQFFRSVQDFENAERTLERIGAVVERTGRRSADYGRLKVYLARERDEYEREQAETGVTSSSHVSTRGQP